MADDITDLIRREKARGFCSRRDRSGPQSRSSRFFKGFGSRRNSNIVEKVRENKCHAGGREGILITEIRRDRKGKYGGDYHSLDETVSSSEMINEIRKDSTVKKLYTVSPVSLPEPNPELVREIKESYRSFYGEPDDKLDVGGICGGYQLAVTEGCVSNPFIIDSELMKLIKKHTRGSRSDHEKAKAIFDWIEQNIQYGEGGRGMYRYKNSKEVLSTKEGICGEMAYLYITMARSCGLKSNYVSVKRDNRNKKVHHGCAAVDTERGRILADPAYHTFDIKHRRFSVISDKEATQMYNSWRY